MAKKPTQSDHDILAALATFDWKSAGLGLPLLASSLAITFDVGFFWGIEINFFNAFSLAEHLVFALQVLPAALICAFFVILYFLLVSAFDPVARRGLTPLVKRYRNSEVYLYWGLLILDIVAIIIVWQLDLRNSLRILATSFFVHQFIRITIPLARTPAMLAVFAVFMALTFSFFFGIDIAHAYLRHTQAHFTISTDIGERRVNVIRSGERGLLYIDPTTKQITLTRWDSIKDIRSLRYTSD
jgi:hypothetical protein